MAYISDKLCHFVGRALNDDYARMNLLVKIIESGVLLANPKTPDEKPSIKTSNAYKRVDSLGEAFENINCVCFCDIPDSDLNIHTKKYSKVGMAFRKDFIAKAGARPVQYVPKDFNMLSNMKECPISQNPAQFFVDINRFEICTLLLLNIMNIQDNRILKMMLEERTTNEAIRAAATYIEVNLPELFNGTSLHAIIYTLMQHSMNANAYVKLFDPLLPENDPENYYMEREWRSLNNIQFTLDDIVSVYLPEDEILQGMFLDHFPALEGKVLTLPGPSQVPIY